MSGNLNIRDGGSSIAYSEEDPYVRNLYESKLAENGLTSEMPARSTPTTDRNGNTRDDALRQPPDHSVGAVVV